MMSDKSVAVDHDRTSCGGPSFCPKCGHEAIKAAAESYVIGQSTPGPWYISPRSGQGQDVYGGTNDLVAEAFGREESTRRANARLIAAAPELLDALKWMVRVFGPVTRMAPTAKSVQAAQAAIARVEAQS